MGFGLRNILNAEKSVEEVYRVLKPNGQFLHLDFGRKNLPSKIYEIITPILTKIFTDNPKAYSYLIKSKREFPEPQDLIKDFESKGFKLKKRKDFIFGVISAQLMQNNYSCSSSFLSNFFTAGISFCHSESFAKSSRISCALRSSWLYTCEFISPPIKIRTDV